MAKLTLSCRSLRDVTTPLDMSQSMDGLPGPSGSPFFVRPRGSTALGRSHSVRPEGRARLGTWSHRCFASNR